MALGCFSWLLGLMELNMIASRLRAGSRTASDTRPPVPLDDPPSSEDHEVGPPALFDPVLGRLLLAEDVDRWTTRALPEHGIGRIVLKGDLAGPNTIDISAARFFFTHAAEIAASVHQLLRESVKTREWTDWVDEIGDLRIGDLWVGSVHRGQFCAILSLELRSPDVFDSCRDWRCDLVGVKATALGFDS
jgi:hypothetical protein